MVADKFQWVFSEPLLGLDQGIGHLAFKWIRILYRCWQERTPYDEAIYLQALKRRNAPLLHNLANVS